MSFWIDAHPDSLDETRRVNPDDLDEIDSLFLENDDASERRLWRIGGLANVSDRCPDLPEGRYGQDQCRRNAGGISDNTP